MADTSANVDFEKVIPDHQVILETGAVLLQTLTDVSGWVTKGASSVNFPTVASTGTQAAVARDGSFTDENFAGADDTFNIDKKLGGSFSVNVHEDDQNIFKTKVVKTKGVLKNMGRQADKDMYDKMLAAASLNHAPTASLLDDVVDMIKELDDANVPNDGERYLYITNASYAIISKEVKDFIRYKTDKDGVVGEIFGVKVVRGNIAGATTDLMYHRAAAAYAYQTGSPKLMSSEDQKATVEGLSLSRMFGGKALQTGDLICKRAI